MEDVSSDASTDSTTFPVKKTPKRPKRPTKPSKPQPGHPSIPKCIQIPNDQLMKKDPPLKQQSELQRTLNVDTACWTKYWRPDNDHLGRIVRSSTHGIEEGSDYLRITRPSKLFKKKNSSRTNPCRNTSNALKNPTFRFKMQSLSTSPFFTKWPH